jgi:tetratricopeptide (TPR) repeat protein
MVWATYIHILKHNRVRFYHFLLPFVLFIALIFDFIETGYLYPNWFMLLILPFVFYFLKNKSKKYLLFVIFLFVVLADVFTFTKSYIALFESKEVATSVIIQTDKPINIFYERVPYHNVLVAAETQSVKIATIIRTQGVYLQKLVFPTNLVHQYGAWQIELASWKDFDIYVVLIIIVFLIVLLFYFYKHKHWLALWGLLAFATSLSLYSNVFFLTPDTLAERFLFLPSFGFSMFFVYGAVILSQYIFSKQVFQYLFLAFLFLPLLSFNTYKTIIRSADWKNNYTLAKNTLPYAENNAVINAQYALELQKLTQLNSNMNVDSANILIAKHYNKALQIYPNFYAVQAELAIFYLNLGEVDSAYKYFSLAKNNNEAEWKNYYYLGMIDYQNQNNLKAIAYFDKVIENKEIYSSAFYQKELLDAYEFKARCLFNLSKKQEAYETLNDAISKFKQKSSFILLANMYRTDQNLPKALQTFKKLQAIFPYDDELNNTIFLLENELKTQN